MSSPFPANARLTFQIPVGDWSDINDLGNPSTTLEPIVVAAYLRSANRVYSGDALAGGQVGKIPVQGRVVGQVVEGEVRDLAELPRSLLPGAKAAIEIDGHPRGDFFLETTIASAWGVDAILGAKLSGYLVSEVAWGDAL